MFSTRQLCLGIAKVYFFISMCFTTLFFKEDTSVGDGNVFTKFSRNKTLLNLCVSVSFSSLYLEHDIVLKRIFVLRGFFLEGVGR